ncbi:MAG: hypothetical protein U5L96_10280 [Owenweeksia sp.]|nr:hypothetical protein [Owenweeksia sp.]
MPVPNTETGNMPKRLQLQLAGEAHLNPGDQTQNLFTRLFIPFKGARVGISLSMVPIEHYLMDTVTRDLRAARDYDAKGFSLGDLYIGTHIQLVRQQEKLPDIMLSINLKTASGNNLYAVRFTEYPGLLF